MTEFVNRPGTGVEGVVGGERLQLGRPTDDVQIGPGETLVELRRGDGTVLGHLAVSDTVKPTSAEAIARFRQLGLEPVLLTGDNRATAESIAAEVGITNVTAEVMPADKVAVISQLQAAGRVVAMVGDGVNDAAALATSDLGIAMGSGTDVAIEASDLTLVRNDLNSAADAIRLSRSDPGHDQGQPVLGLRLQRVGDSAGDVGPTLACHRGCSDGLLQRVRGDQLVAPQAFQGDALTRLVT